MYIVNPGQPCGGGRVVGLFDETRSVRLARPSVLTDPCHRHMRGKPDQLWTRHAHGVSIFCSRFLPTVGEGDVFRSVCLPTGESVHPDTLPLVGRPPSAQ